MTGDDYEPPGLAEFRDYDLYLNSLPEPMNQDLKDYPFDKPEKSIPISKVKELIDEIDKMGRYENKELGDSDFIDKKEVINKLKSLIE